MNNNKKILTIEKLKKENNLSKKNVFFYITFFSISIIIELYDIFDIIQSNKHIIEIIFEIFLPLSYIILSSFFIYCLTFAIKNENKENLFIDSRNFKIVEDKICDKYGLIFKENNKRSSRNYYIICKTYGEINIDYKTFKGAEKNNLIYLLVYNDNKNNDDSKSSQVDQFYLASKYELNDELKNYFIPYDEQLYETHFYNKFKRNIKQFDTIKGKIKCGNCGKIYDDKIHKFCPECDLSDGNIIEDILYIDE